MCPSDDGLSSVPDDLPPVFIDRTLALTRKAAIKGRDYWFGLRGNRIMPARSEISPRDMREFLPHVGLVERVALPEGGIGYAMRLAGGRIEEIFGPLTGQPLDVVLPPETAVRWRKVFDEVIATQTPLAVSGRVAYASLRHLKYELFIAPLDLDGKPDMLFGVLDIWPVT